MTDARDIALFLEIAQRAIEVEDRATERRDHEAMLKSAYLYHKRKHGLDRVETGTAEWDGMMAATKVEYDDAEKARRAEYNAKRRLQTAIRRQRVRLAA